MHGLMIISYCVSLATIMHTSHTQAIDIAIPWIRLKLNMNLKLNKAAGGRKPQRIDLHYTICID